MKQITPWAPPPILSPAQAFARVFEDPANAALAAKAHRRPLSDHELRVSSVIPNSRPAPSTSRTGLNPFVVRHEKGWRVVGDSRGE
jgi:hypothetical protein